jgi:signal transduction histidine kinase
MYLSYSAYKLYFIFLLLISPPYWQTWWFKFALVCILATTIFFVYKKRIKNIEKRKEYLETLLKEKSKLNEQLKTEIKQHKQVEIELRDSKEEAEKLGRIKSDFLAQVSHEIRTPLHAILNFSSIIKDEIEEKNGSSIDIEKYFNGIKISGKRITRTIDLILNMSEIQTGAYKYHPTTFDIYEKVIKVIHFSFYQEAFEAGLKLILEKETDDTVINADEYSVNQIIYHLVDNAIKFTKQGNVFIRIYKNKSNELVVDIEDTGIGISEEYLSNIFAPFSQEQQGYSRGFEGNGLGLSLVKKYCDLNNIHIDIRSKKGLGSTFSLTFLLTS